MNKISKYVLRTTLLAAVLTVAACTDPKGASEALQDQGYKDVQITGYSWFGCGQDDQYKTAFTATTPAGVRIRGVVCVGVWGKGETIRTFGRD